MFLKSIKFVKAVAATVALTLAIGFIATPNSTSAETNKKISIEVTSGEDVILEMRTSSGVKPELPSKIVVNSEGGTKEEVNIFWEDIEYSSYESAGAFTIYGQLENKEEKAKANITVVDGEGPLFSYEAVSDTHVTSKIDSTYSKNFDKVLKEIDSVNSGTGANSIGLVINGDVTDHGSKAEWDVYNQILENNNRDTSDIYETFGNHDTWSGFNNSLNLFYENTGTDTVYFDKWMEGYHYIFLGTEKYNGNDAWLSDTQISWFEEKLAEEAEDDKPIFVFLHQGLIDTCAGTKEYQGWHGVDQDAEMQEIIARYPQVMMFSGHSHWQLISEDTVFDDGKGTFVNTAATSYLWSDAGKTINGSEGWFLDVYEDKVVLKGRDFSNSEWIEGAQQTIYYNEENEKYNVYMNDLVNIEGKEGVEINVPMFIDAFPVDEDVRSAEITFELPDEISIKDVILNDKAISSENWDYKVTEGKLRIALTNLDGTVLKASSDIAEKDVLTLQLELNYDMNAGDSISVKMISMILRANDNIDIAYNVEKAIANITFVEKEVVQAFPRELYETEKEDVLPENHKAYAIEFTGLESLANITANEGFDLYFSPEFTERNGKLTYVALVSNDVTVDMLANIDTYAIEDNKEADNKIVFGDFNGDGIDAQDALAAVSAWLRSIELEDKELVSINVSGDGSINTRDAIDIVDNYVSGKEFKILSK